MCFGDLLLLLKEWVPGPWRRPGILCMLGCLPLKFLLLYLCTLQGTAGGPWGPRGLGG